MGVDSTIMTTVTQITSKEQAELQKEQELKWRIQNSCGICGRRAGWNEHKLTKQKTNVNLKNAKVGKVCALCIKTGRGIPMKKLGKLERKALRKIKIGSLKRRHG